VIQLLYFRCCSERHSSPISILPDWVQISRNSFPATYLMTACVYFWVAMKRWRKKTGPPAGARSDPILGTFLVSKLVSMGKEERARASQAMAAVRSGALICSWALSGAHE